jgi:hypothetical protein
MPLGSRLRTFLLAAALATAALAVPTSAAAQGWTCEASAFAGSVLTSPREAPISANRGQPACATAVAGPATPAGFPLPLSGSLLSAQTRLDGPAGDPGQQTAFAAGGLAELRVRSLPALPFSVPQPGFGDMGAVTVPGVGSVDLRPALQALVPARQLPDLDLVRVQGARAEVTGRCVDGAPQLTSTASVARLTINGVDVGADQAVSQVITLVDTAGIDPSNADIAKIVGPPGVDLSPLQAQIQPVLDALPTIVIPATVAHVNVSPGRRTEAGGRLTQTALEIRTSIGGQNLANLTVGEATVGATDVSCGGVAEAALQCTNRRLALIDVLQRRGRVHLLGAAARELTGQRVTIRFTANGRVVARPRVGADGLFRATAPLPPRAIRGTNRARYRAHLGRQKSLRLKLARRMVIQSTRVSGSRVTIAGRVVRPLAEPVRTVIVERRVSCGRYEVVRRFKPGSDGRFRVRLAGPGGGRSAVFRMRTQVRRNTRSSTLFPTFTLPRFVDLTS